MAAAGLCAALGGTKRADRERTEIAMEHHRHDLIRSANSFRSLASNATPSARSSDHRRLVRVSSNSRRAVVSLDSVIVTIGRTGADMQSKYKETKLGGLAVDFFLEC